MIATTALSPSPPSAEHGFTLVELLAAMVAGSLILATLSWTLATLGRELGASKLAEPRHQLDAAAPMLTGLIEQMQPVHGNDRKYVARPRDMEFVTSPPAALGAVGAVRASLEVRRERKGDSLYARFAPQEASDNFPTAARSERLLAEGYRSIGFDYLMPPRGEEGLPPKLVTISLTDSGGRTTRIAAAPRLTAGGDCRFDPVSMTCRR